MHEHLPFPPTGGIRQALRRLDQRKKGRKNMAEYLKSSDPSQEEAVRSSARPGAYTRANLT